MPRLETIKRLGRRWFTSFPFFALLGLILGAAIAIPLVAKPSIAIVTIAQPVLDQSYVDDILDRLRFAREDRGIKAVILQIDSPGGFASAIEQVYLDVLWLRSRKPVVASLGTIAASGGYYAAVAADFIYALPSSAVGSIGAWVNLPRPEELDENEGTSGPFKAMGSSRRQALAELEMVRQEFVAAVKSQRGERLKLSEEELSQAIIYLGVESLRYGLIDAIGTRSAAIEKAASLAGIRKYEVVEIFISRPSDSFDSSDLAALKSQVSLAPVYYYLYFESE